jgi:hypothetical protein
MKIDIEETKEPGRCLFKGKMRVFLVGNGPGAADNNM